MKKCDHETVPEMFKAGGGGRSQWWGRDNRESWRLSFSNITVEDLMLELSTAFGRVGKLYSMITNFY